MSIEPSKILTVSARDYSELVHLPLDSFEAEGVEVSGLLRLSKDSSDLGISKRLASQVSPKVEVVVNYRVVLSYDEMITYHASGTALIRKSL